MIINLVNEALGSGARQGQACAVLGVSARALQRWHREAEVGVDRRTLRGYEPPHKLSAEERAAVLTLANSAEFGHLPPSQIVPRLADSGRFFQVPGKRTTGTGPQKYAITGPGWKGTLPDGVDNLGVSIAA